MPFSYYALTSRVLWGKRIDLDHVQNRELVAHLMDKEGLELKSLLVACVGQLGAFVSLYSFGETRLSHLLLFRIGADGFKDRLPDGADGLSYERLRGSVGQPGSNVVAVTDLPDHDASGIRAFVWVLVRTQAIHVLPLDSMNDAEHPNAPIFYDGDFACSVKDQFELWKVTPFELKRVFSRVKTILSDLNALCDAGNRAFQDLFPSKVKVSEHELPSSGLPQPKGPFGSALNLEKRLASFEQEATEEIDWSRARPMCEVMYFVNGAPPTTRHAARE